MQALTSSFGKCTLSTAQQSRQSARPVSVASTSAGHVSTKCSAFNGDSKSLTQGIFRKSAQRQLTIQAAQGGKKKSSRLFDREEGDHVFTKEDFKTFNFDSVENIPEEEKFTDEDWSEFESYFSPGFLGKKKKKDKGPGLDSGKMGPPTQTFDAIIEVGGHQKIIQKGRFYSCHNLKLPPGTEINLERVLAIKDGEELHLGRPYLKGAKVKAKIMENYRGKKVIVYKYKAKKHYRKKAGFRASLTKFLVTDVTMA